MKSELMSPERSRRTKRTKRIQKSPLRGIFEFIYVKPYFNSTFAPAASSFFFASSAVALLTPVRISLGALLSLFFVGFIAIGWYNRCTH
jgi:hypothetical protein